MSSESPARKAFLIPFFTFIGFLCLSQVLQSLFGGGRSFWLTSPQYWIYPLQTVVCGVLLIRFWPLYELKPIAKAGFAIGIGMVALALWIAPQVLSIQPPRLDGFNPFLFRDHYPLFLLVVFFRFFRSVVVVPLLEEIFWRGYLLRDLIDHDFTKVAFGTFSWISFGVVTVGFCLEHASSDWPAAIITGVLYNWVAYRTKSLSACVIAHAVTNLLLGFYIMATKQWGFW